MIDSEYDEVFPFNMCFKVKQPNGNWLTIEGGQGWVGFWTNEASRDQSVGFDSDKLDAVIEILQKIKRECCPPHAQE